MLSMANCPPFPLCNSASAPATAAFQSAPTSSLVPPPNGPPKFLRSGAMSHRRLLSASPQLRRGHLRDGLSVGAVKTRRKDQRLGPLEMDGFYDDEDEEEDEDEDEMMVPFGKMKEWMERKPRGFGVDKVYDTSVEDKLLDEIEQSRQAQVTNINNLKNSPIKPKPVPKKDASQFKVAEITPGSIRVRVINLPKKKNIHRDLKLAFHGSPGILNIVPVVSGNEKTRDPVCKGLAFVDFKTEKHAVRFIETFSRQSILFGKVQKQIKCEMFSDHSSNPDSGGSEDESHAAATPKVDLDIKAEPEVLSELDDSLSDAWEDPFPGEEDDLDGDLVEVELGEPYEVMRSLTLSELNTNDSLDDSLISPSASSFLEDKIRRAVSTKKPVRSQAKKQKKPSGKGTGAKVKVKKLVVPGSAKRLKIREKAVLTGVFAKYGSNADLASNQDS